MRQRVWALAMVAAVACLVLGCSPKVSAGDAAAGVDAVGGDGLDSAGDGEGDGGEEIVDADADAIVEPEVISDADAIADADAISDVITDTTSDAAEVDTDAIADVDVIADVDTIGDTAPLPSDCTGDALLPPPDATILVDVGPVVPNKVVTGCGKGKPEPVAQGTQCCDCPPPYSCYCNGECAWLRTPDLNIPAEGGEGVWTGKWVVAMTNYFVGFNEKLQAVHKVAIERWNPESTMGFLLSKHPEPDLLADQLRLFVVGGKVLVATETWGAPGNASGLGPDRPAYWYDPETDKYEPIVMPKCSGLVATATHLACCDGGFGGDKGAVHLYDVAAKSWSKVKAPAGLLPPGESICWETAEDLIADDSSLYFINPVYNYGTAIWPDGTKASDVGHVIRYTVAAGMWKDVGVVPASAMANGKFVLHSENSIFFAGAIAAPGMYTQLARFDLATGKTTITLSSIEFLLQPQVAALDCGIFVAGGRYFGPIGPTGQTNKYNVPAFIHPDLSMELFPNWGYPSDDRGIATVLKTDKDLLVLGGYNGGYEHKDGYRYPISQICKGVKP